MMLTLFAIVASASAATDVYLAKYRYDLYTCEANGSNPSTLDDPGSGYRYNGISVANNYIYTGTYNSTIEDIRRYDLDGANETAIISGVEIGGDSLRVTDNYIYYGYATGAAGLISGGIYRMDLDGGNNTWLYTSSYGVQSLWIMDDAIYWLAESRRIWTCGLDGSNATELLNNSLDRTLGGMVTDGNYIYYTIDGGNTLNRRDMDGTNLTVLMTDAAAITVSDSLRLLDGRLYWTNAGEAIYSAAADGSEASATEQFNMTSTFGVTSGYTTYIDFLIPEPTTMGLLAFGSVMLLRRRRTVASR